MSIEVEWDYIILASVVWKFPNLILYRRLTIEGLHSNKSNEKCATLLYIILLHINNCVLNYHHFTFTTILNLTVTYPKHNFAPTIIISQNKTEPIS